MREPPAFAKDQWCWEYTKEKINGNCLRKHGYELDYEDWEAKHFMGAAAIYKNVVKKYGEGRQPEGPFLCPRCDKRGPHPANDYICHECRFGV